MPGPAYRIHTPRLVLRCWNPADAAPLVDAITESLEHLREWMHWAAAEPQTLDEKVEFLRRARGDFDHGNGYAFGMFDPGGERVLGSIGLMKRVGAGGLEVGYWLHRGQVGRGLATEATAAVVRVAFEVEKAQRVEIHCDPGNVRSARVPERLGFVHEATLRQRPLPNGSEFRDTMLWTLFAADYPGTPAARAELEAFDAIGRRIL